VSLLRRRLEELLDRLRSILEGDAARAREIGALTTPAKRSILPRIPSQDRGAVLEQLRHLRLLCDVHMLEYEQMLDVAAAFYGTGISWIGSLEEVIALIEQTHGGVRAGAQSDQPSGHDGGPEPLDRPNPRLPFARE